MTGHNHHEDLFGGRFAATRSDVGRQMLDKASRLKLHAWKHDDGLSLTFEFAGDIEAADGDVATASDSFRFVRELLGEFERRNGEGGVMP